MQTILTAALTGAFQPSKAFLITNGLAVIDFDLDAGAGPAAVEWYFELTSEKPSAPQARWFREVSEEDTGTGLVEQPPTLRRFSNLTGVVRLDNQSAKAHDFCRVQIRAAAGAIKATISTPFGLAT